MQLSGAQIVVQSLKAEGVEYVFGYPGGAVIEIYDAIFQLNKFKHILTRHEQAAVHAADAYARVSGKVGVALVTSGPGVTNALTGIATAYSDSIPLVIISGQVGNSLIGTDAFQEVDTVGITRPCVKHNFLVTNIGELADTIKKAFQIAASGVRAPLLSIFLKMLLKRWPNSAIRKKTSSSALTNRLYKVTSAKSKKPYKCWLLPNAPSFTSAAAWYWAMPPRK